MSGAERLYTPELLALAVGLARYPLTDDFPLTGEARSRSCGSTLRMGLAIDRHEDGEGRIERIGMRVAACAVGQASAAIFAQGAQGVTAGELARTLAALEAWFGGDAPAPEWPGLDAIAPARDFPGRHGAMLLPWRAALDALSKPGGAG